MRRFSQTAYLEFYVILSALIVGYVWAKAFPGDRAGRAGLAFNHLKGVAVPGAAAALTVLLLGGSEGAAPLAGIVLCAVISFYYGSRC